MEHAYYWVSTIIQLITLVVLGNILEHIKQSKNDKEKN